MKAYWCGGEISEHAELIYAESAGKARGYSVGFEACCDLMFTEIKVLRAHGADQHLDPAATSPYRVEIGSKDGAAIWRDAGGHDESNRCSSCDLCEMRDAGHNQKWLVCEYCQECGECRDDDGPLCDGCGQCNDCGHDDKCVDR